MNMLNISYLEEQTAHTPEVLAEVLKSFAGELKACEKQLHNYSALQNWEEVHKVMHCLRSMMSIVSDEEIKELVHQLAKRASYTQDDLVVRYMLNRYLKMSACLQKEACQAIEEYSLQKAV
jgi:hypothetical protein